MITGNIKQKELLTLPNMLSFYRLCSFPFILYFILVRAQTVFIILMVINLLTDILDGYFARRFHCETRLGAKLDSLADEGMYILGLAGIWILKKPELEPYKTGLMIFAAAYLLTLIVSLLKFKTLPGLHLYSSKVGGYLQGIFLIVLADYFNNSLLFILPVLIVAICDPLAWLAGTYFKHRDNNRIGSFFYFCFYRLPDHVCCFWL